MGRRFRPTASKIVEKRVNKPTSQVKIPSQDEKEWLDKFSGLIFFWSFTIGKVKPHDHSTIFRVTTHRYVPKHKLFPLVEAAFPEGCKVSLVRGYVFTHSLDVRTTDPMRWDEFILRVTKALEGVL